MAIPTTTSGATERQANRFRIGVLLVMRNGSTRLPRKPLRIVSGRPVMLHLLDRLRAIRDVDGIVLCTTTRLRDGELADLAREQGVDVFRGSEANVPARLMGAVRQFGFDFVLIAEGDEVFIDPASADRVILVARDTGAEYVALRDYPVGACLFGVRASALQRASDAYGHGESVNTDGWGRMFLDRERFAVEWVEPLDPQLRRPQYRLTLDYPEDLRVIEELYGRLYRPGTLVSLRQALSILDEDPALVAINRERAEEYSRLVQQYPNIAESAG